MTHKMARLCKIFNFNEATFFHAISLFDAFSSFNCVEKKMRNSIFLICLTIAAKIKEDNGKTISGSAFRLLQNETNEAFFSWVETKLLLWMRFDANATTPFDFLKILMEHPATYYPFDSSNLECPFVKELSTSMKKLLYLSALDYETNKFTSISIASSVVYIAREMMDIEDLWPLELSAVTSLNVSDLKLSNHFLLVHFSNILPKQLNVDFDFQFSRKGVNLIDNLSVTSEKFIISKKSSNFSI